MFGIERTVCMKTTEQIAQRASSLQTDSQNQAQQTAKALVVARQSTPRCRCAVTRIVGGDDDVVGDPLMFFCHT